MAERSLRSLSRFETHDGTTYANATAAASSKGINALGSEAFAGSIEGGSLPAQLWQYALKVGYGLLDRRSDRGRISRSATGARLIWADLAHDLDHPEDLQSLVSCALGLDDWDGSWDEPVFVESVMCPEVRGAGARALRVRVQEPGRVKRGAPAGARTSPVATRTPNSSW